MLKKEPTLLFILGRGRSGTSLLQTILNAHPNISVAPEAQFIMFLRKLYENANWNSKTILAFSKDLWLEERLHNWHLKPEDLEKSLLGKTTNINFSGLCKEVYTQYGLSKGKNPLKVVGDKNPHYALYVKHLAKLYPNAKFVHLVRDPRDTILSYKQVNFDANNTSTLAWRWNYYNKAVMKYRVKMPNRFYFMKFEDLLKQPEKTLTELCLFLNVEYNPEMLEFYKKEQDWETDFRKNLKKPLDPAKVYQWKKKMTNRQIKQSTSIVSVLANEFGYEITIGRKKFRKIISFPYYLYAKWLITLEKLVYWLPLGLVAPIIKYYRKITAPKPKT